MGVVVTQALPVKEKPTPEEEKKAAEAHEGDGTDDWVSDAKCVLLYWESFIHHYFIGTEIVYVDMQMFDTHECYREKQHPELNYYVLMCVSNCL